MTSVMCDCLQTHRRDRACLQRHLAASHEIVRLLRTRMDELIRFMEDLLSVTPAQGQEQARRELMMSRLNETLELLADVAAKHIDYGMIAFCSIPYHGSCRCACIFFSKLFTWLF